MNFAQTTLSQLRRSDLFVENGSVQGFKLRRSGIVCQRTEDAAPTELKNRLPALAAKRSPLRGCKTGASKSRLLQANTTYYRLIQPFTPPRGGYVPTDVNHGRADLPVSRGRAAARPCCVGLAPLPLCAFALKTPAKAQTSTNLYKPAQTYTKVLTLPGGDTLTFDVNHGRADLPVGSGRAAARPYRVGFANAPVLKPLNFSLRGCDGI
jgi:hypothetical protein